MKARVATVTVQEMTEDCQVCVLENSPLQARYWGQVRSAMTILLHHLHELVKVDAGVTVLIKLTDHFAHLLSGDGPQLLIGGAVQHFGQLLNSDFA